MKKTIEVAVRSSYNERLGVHQAVASGVTVAVHAYGFSTVDAAKAEARALDNMRRGRVDGSGEGR